MAKATSPENPGVILSVEEKVAYVTFNRPKKLNPISPATLNRIVLICDELRDKPEIRAVVFRGEGRAFSAGADLGALARRAKDEGPPLLENRLQSAVVGQQACEAVERLPQVTVASTQSYVVGGAFALSLACDFRIASEDSEWWLPEVDLGLPMTWGSIPRLLALVGPSRTKEIIMTCDRIPAAKGLTWNLVNAVVPNDDLERQTMNFVDKILSKPPVAIGMTKQAVNAISQAWARESIYADPYLMLLASRTSDSAEAMLARAQKRKPKFEGR